MSRVAQVQLEPCVPPAWARGGHAQTILGHLLPSRAARALGELDDGSRDERVEFALPDGDRLVARHAPGRGNAVLYLFHGIASEISAAYMVRTAALGRALGWDVYRVNHRGCGEGQGLARRPYHSGRAEDLSEAIRAGRARHPGKRHIAVGFSLSANALLLLLTGRRGEVQPDAAIAVNGPIHLANAAQLLEQGMNRVYDLRFSIECRMDVAYRRRRGLLGDRRYRFPWLASLREFDAIYTCPESGFPSREEYYSTCSTHEHLAAVRVPTVLLTAQDDPFIDYRDYVGAARSEHVHLHVEPHGGHLGYLTARPTPLGSDRWLDYALWEYLKAL
jgi:predicted alpha/beta-fold hydrolase